MRIRPLASYPAVKYPTRCEVDRHPELLRTMPARWRHAVMLVAVSMACLTMSGCIGKARGHFGNVEYTTEEEAHQIAVDAYKQAALPDTPVMANTQIHTSITQPAPITPARMSKIERAGVLPDNAVTPRRQLRDFLVWLRMQGVI